MATGRSSPPTSPWWNPGAHGRRRPYLIKRQMMLKAVREFFASQDFVEVETPALQVSPGLEPHLMAFATELVAPDERRSRLYLHTSPEFAMKKLLAAGEERIFQIARVFRNGERSDTHHPEFAMLEWYRAGAGYKALMDDCEGLLAAAAAAVGARYLRWKGLAADPTIKAERISVAEAFSRHAGIDVLATAPVAEAPDVRLLAAEARRIGVRVAEGDDWEDIFFRVFLERVEPKLGHPAATILHDYPISMAALSRPKADDPRLAERFELYAAGLELANAFSELTDADEQRRRFAAWRRAKEARYGMAYPVDEELLAALPAMPECAGIALGIDRLAMLATGAQRIEDVLWAPVAEGDT